jgi:endonuclease YncB( thermonuclease family)
MLTLVLTRARFAVPVLALVALTSSTVAGQRGTSDVNRQDLVRRQFDAKVVRVGDADTLDVIVAGESRSIRVRLEGIDAPEQDEVFSREATALMRTLVFDRMVRVTGRTLDRYGRLIVRVSANGRDVSTELVGAGLACHAYAYDAALARAEARARAAGAGFWAPMTTKKPACVVRTAFSAKRPGSPERRKPKLPV